MFCGKYASQDYRDRIKETLVLPTCIMAYDFTTIEKWVPFSYFLAMEELQMQNGTNIFSFTPL